MEFGFSFGTNLDDRIQFMRDARQAVLAVEGTRELAASPLYETDPVDVLPEYQDLKFVNGVLIIESPRSADEWLELLNLIETAMGRVRTGDKNAPRPIDIDILYAGDQCIDSGGLLVPHPRWATRRFVLQPLDDVRGEMMLPKQ
ncbi:MAG: 2-amino-4-hydroxy-6-hydroxymethyldihydropteridine diphosphokinase, partial [Kiritimatiellia bacterium]